MDSIQSLQCLIEHNAPNPVLDWEITKGAFPNSLIVSCFVVSPQCEEVLDINQAIIDVSCNIVLNSIHDRITIEISYLTSPEVIPNLIYMCDVENVTDTLIRLRMYNASDNDTKEKFIQL